MDNYENKERSLYCHWDTHEHDVLFMNEYDLDQHLYSHFMNLSDSMMNQTDYGENSGLKNLGNPATALSVGEPVKDEKAQAVECHWDSCHETFNLDDIMGHLRQNHLEESMRPHHGACMDIDRHLTSSSNVTTDEKVLEHQHKLASGVHNSCDHSHEALHSSSHEHVHSHNHSEMGHLATKNMPIPELSNLATPQSHDSPLAPFDGAVNDATPIVSPQNMDQPYTIKHHSLDVLNPFNEVNYNTVPMLPVLPDSSSGGSVRARSNGSSRVSSVEPSRPPSVPASRVTSQNPSRQSSAPNSPIYVSPSSHNFGNNSEIKIDTANLPRLNTPEAMVHDRHQCLWSVGDGKICGEIFLTSTELNAHIVHHHIDTNDQTTCHWDGCHRVDAPFRQKQKLVRHLQTHARAGDHKCRVCKKQMSDETQLKLHLQGHTESRPFKCDVCQRGFRTHKNLVAHMRTHTGDKPLVCTFPGCGKRFAESSNLAKHRRTHEAPKFECHICKRKFTRRDHLVRHQRSKKHFGPEDLNQGPNPMIYQPSFDNKMSQLNSSVTSVPELTNGSRISSPMVQQPGPNDSGVLPPQPAIATPGFNAQQTINSSPMVGSQIKNSHMNNSHMSIMDNSQMGNSQMGNSQIIPQSNYPMSSMNPMMNSMMPHSSLLNQAGHGDQMYANSGYQSMFAQHYASPDQQALSRIPYGNLASIPTQLNALASQLNANQLNVPANQLAALATQLESNQFNGTQMNGTLLNGAHLMNGSQFSERPINGNHMAVNGVANSSQFGISHPMVNDSHLTVPTTQSGTTQLTPQGSPADQSAVKQLDGSSYSGQPFVAAS